MQCMHETNILRRQVPRKKSLGKNSLLARLGKPPWPPCTRRVRKQQAQSGDNLELRHIDHAAVGDFERGDHGECEEGQL